MFFKAALLLLSLVEIKAVTVDLKLYEIIEDTQVSLKNNQTLHLNMTGDRILRLNCTTNVTGHVIIMKEAFTTEEQEQENGTEWTNFTTSDLHATYEVKYKVPAIDLVHNLTCEIYDKDPKVGGRPKNSVTVFETIESPRVSTNLFWNVIMSEDTTFYVPLKNGSIFQDKVGVVYDVPLLLNCTTNRTDGVLAINMEFRTKEEEKAARITYEKYASDSTAVVYKITFNSFPNVDVRVNISCNQYNRKPSDGGRVISYSYFIFGILAPYVEANMYKIEDENNLLLENRSTLIIPHDASNVFQINCTSNLTGGALKLVAEFPPDMPVRSTRVELKNSSDLSSSYDVIYTKRLEPQFFNLSCVRYNSQQTWTSTVLNSTTVAIEIEKAEPQLKMYLFEDGKNTKQLENGQTIKLQSEYTSLELNCTTNVEESTVKLYMDRASTTIFQKVNETKFWSLYKITYDGKKLATNLNLTSELWFYCYPYGSKLVQTINIIGLHPEENSSVRIQINVYSILLVAFVAIFNLINFSH